MAVDKTVCQDQGALVEYIIAHDFILCLDHFVLRPAQVSQCGI